jgi:hypothetical protein
MIGRRVEDWEPIENIFPVAQGDDVARGDRSAKIELSAKPIDVLRFFRIGQFRRDIAIWIKAIV